MKTLGLSVLVALGTPLAMAAVGLAFFTTGGGIVFPAIVARATAALNCATAATAMIERRIDPIVAIQPDRGGRISVDQKW